MRPDIPPVGLTYQSSVRFFAFAEIARTIDKGEDFMTVSIELACILFRPWYGSSRWLCRVFT